MVKNYLIDIDGTICDDIPNEHSDKFLEAKVFPDALERLNKWYDEGHIITFFTARESKHRKITEYWLKVNKFKYHGLIMDKPRGGNYHWIDNHIVRATKFNGKWTELVTKKVDAQVFED